MTGAPSPPAPTTKAFNISNFTKDLRSLGDKVSHEFNNEILPLAQRTSRRVQERIGQVSADDISQLPSEYVELADKCNNIERLYRNVLKVTVNYEHESYDYPLNLQELFSEFSRNVQLRVNNLARATTPAEAQAALVLPEQEYRPPKTLYHALARATDGSVLDAAATAAGGGGDADPLVRCLDLYLSNLLKIANARLGQDQLIKTRFNAPLTATLRQLILQSNAIQKKVEQKRIDYDLARVALAGCLNPAREPQLRVAMENAEDDFANTVEDAILVMQNVLAHAKPVEEFGELVKAQLAYHKLALELLGGLVHDFEALVDEKKGTARDAGDFDI